MFKLYLLSNGKVALQASNDKYLSRIAYSNDAFDDYNHVQPIKDTADYFSQFEFEYAEEDGPFENLGKVQSIWHLFRENRSSSLGVTCTQISFRENAIQTYMGIRFFQTIHCVCSTTHMTI